jgi:hypothetical protein
MKANKKRLSIKAQIRAERERERKIATVIFTVLILTAILVSAYFVYTYIGSQAQFVGSAYSFKAVIVDQLSLMFPNNTFTEEAERILKDAGYTVDYYSANEVNVDFYKSLIRKGYGLIILRVHSAQIGESTQIGFFTSQSYSKTQYISEQLSDQVFMATPQMSVIQLYSGNFPKYFAIGPKLIQQASYTRLGNATIIAMGCDSLRFADMAQAFIEKGAKAYIGWNGSVSADHTDKATINLLQHLITEKQTIKQAIENTIKEVGPDPTYNSQLTYYPLNAAECTIKKIEGT